MSGENRTLTADELKTRSSPVSRSANRTDQDSEVTRRVAGAERKTEARAVALGRMAKQAQSYVSWLEATQWTPPLDPVLIAAEFGDYGLWANHHIGIDFNGDTGTPSWPSPVSPAMSMGPV